MSTAKRFLHLRHFPFCVQELDLETIDWTDVDPTVLYIKDLSYGEAMAMFWNLETIDVKFNVSGINYFNYEGDDSVASVDFDSTLSMGYERPPKRRVCTLEWLLLALTGTTADGETITHPPDGDFATRDASFTFGLTSLGPQDPYPLRYDEPVTRQPDGKYTLWIYLEREHFHLDRSGPYIDIIGFGEGTTVDEIISGPHSIPVLSGGSLVYNLRFKNSTTTGLYYFGGTINDFTFTPNFYTYS